MPNPSADFPTTVHSATDVSGYGSTALGSTAKTHTAVHGKVEQELTAINQKIGTGSSTPTADIALVGTGAGTSAWRALTKTDVGLSNVDNTTDANKPVSTAVSTALGLKANDLDVVHDTGNETVAGIKTFSTGPVIPDEAYGAGWDGSLEPATKNAIYDKVETIAGGSGISEALAIAYAVAL